MADPQQPKLRLKDRRRRLVWVKVAAGTSVVVISLLLVWYGARTPALIVEHVSVSGIELSKADALKQTVEVALQGSFVYLIPKKNAFVLPKGDIESAILRTFPEVASATVVIKDLNTLEVTVHERTPTALWCEGEDVKATQASCYVMDTTGFIFASATDVAGFVRYYGSLSGKPLGSLYLKGDFTSLHTLVKDIGNAIGHTPEAVEVNADTNDVSLAFVGGGVVKFVRTAEKGSTLENIASVFASQDFKSNKQFEYVDFRFGNKVYVKFK